jgi:hypothetical protein
MASRLNLAAFKLTLAAHTLQNPALDGALFRAHPSLSQLPQTMRPITHPVSRLVNLVASEAEEICVWGDRGTEKAVVELRSLCQEMATYPSSSRVVIRGLGNGRWIINRNGVGVSVGQIIHKAAELWNEPYLEDGESLSLSHAFALDSDDEGASTFVKSYAEYYSPTCLQQLFENSDHVFFEGWTSCSVDGVGRTVLDVSWFGS